MSSSGSLDSDSVTQALICHANTRCKVLQKSPAELAFGRTLKDFFPRSVASLLPIPANILSGDMKDKLQGKIRAEMGQKWSEHTKVLPDLKNGDFVQLQNLTGRNPLKSDYNGIIVGRHNLHSYAVKVNGTGRITVRNRASLRKILPPVLIPDVHGVQAPAVCDQGARLGLGSTESQAPQRAGLRSGVNAANNIIVSGAASASRIQDPGNFQESSSGVPGAVSAMGSPGQSRFQAGPGKVPGAVSALGPPGQSGLQAGAVLVGSRRQGAGGSGGTPGDRLAGGQGRSVTMNVPDDFPVVSVDVPVRPVPDFSVQGDAVSVGQGGSTSTASAAEVVLPVVRRSSRVSSKVFPYQAGSSGMT